MSTKSIGEEEGCCTVIQDYLINAGENAGGEGSQPSCFVLCPPVSQRAVCETITRVGAEWVTLQ